MRWYGWFFSVILVGAFAAIGDIGYWRLDGPQFRSLSGATLVLAFSAFFIGLGISRRDTDDDDDERPSSGRHRRDDA